MNLRHSLTTNLRRASCVLALSGLLLAGCSSSGPGEVRFEPQDKLLDYEHSFASAYAAPSAGGGYDIVLVSGFTPESQTHGKVVRPAEYRPLRQIMHVQVAWRPPSGARADSPAATNATIRYHVLSGEPTGPASRASYSGAGFVRLDVDEEETHMDIRDALLRPLAIVGSARDPIGPSRLTGRVVAENNAPRVRALLEQLDEALAAAPVAANP